MSTRHGSDHPMAGPKAQESVNPGSARCAAKAAAHTAMMAIVAIGRPVTTSPPKIVRACRTVAAPAATQSTHWMPTAAGRWQDGQTGRSHRWQRT